MHGGLRNEEQAQGEVVIISGHSKISFEALEPRIPDIPNYQHNSEYKYVLSKKQSKYKTERAGRIFQSNLRTSASSSFRVQPTLPYPAFDEKLVEFACFPFKG
jgi:hypothetical protein